MQTPASDDSYSVSSARDLLTWAGVECAYPGEGQVLALSIDDEVGISADVQNSRLSTLSIRGSQSICPLHCTKGTQPRTSQLA